MCIQKIRSRYSNLFCHDLNLTNPQEFARPDSGDFFDGFRIDADNNIWSSCGKGIKCFALFVSVIGVDEVWGMEDRYIYTYVNTYIHSYIHFEIGI